MSVESVWFGPEDRPLHGRLHRPDDGHARGAVVVCPPVGVDLSHSYANLRLLAEALEARGLLVLRFDYDGTGQSAGTMDDPARVRAWLDSIHAAVALVRDAGAGRVGAVGLRLGATLAAAAAAEAALDALVLWDPYLSGTAFLREQLAVKVGVQPPVRETVPGLALPGYVLPREAAAELERLELPEADALPVRTAVFVDTTRRTRPRLAERLRGPNVEWEEYGAESSIFDVGVLGYTIPRALVERVAERTVAAYGDPAAPLPPRRQTTAAVVVDRCADGRPILEEPLRLGSRGLFGVSCAPARAAEHERRLPTLLFLTIAAESSIGPARLWVDLGRRLAREGYRSVRFDFSGIGESPPRPGQPPRPLYSPEALGDIADVARAVSPRDPGNVVLVGVCSGGYAALAAARRLRPRGIVAVNPIMTERGFEERGGGGPAAVAELGRGSPWRLALAGRLPAPVWRLVYALDLAHSPARLLAPAWEEDVPTLLICGAEEARLPKRRTPRALRRLSASGGSQFEEIPSLDHGLSHHASRETVHARLRRHLDAVAARGQRAQPKGDSNVNGGSERSSARRRFASMSR